MKKSTVLLAAFVCFTLCGISVQAAIKYWDINGTATGAGGSTPAGTWENVSTNWNDDSTGEAGGTITAWTATTVADDTAVFSAGSDATGSFTVTVGDGITGYQAGFSQITFEEGTVEIKGTTVGATAYATLFPPNTAAVDGTIQVNSGAAATLNIGIPNVAGNLVKTGPGTLTIANTIQAWFGFGNTADSYLKISEGVYSVPDVGVVIVNGSSVTKMGRARDIYLGSASTAGTWEYTGAAATFGTHGTYGTRIVLGDGGGEIKNIGSGELTIGGPCIITGSSGTLTISGTQPVRLGLGATPSDYSGNTVINSGATLVVGGADVLPYGAGKGNVTVNGLLDTVASAAVATINGLTGSGTVNGASLFTIGNNDATATFSGDVGAGDGLSLVKVGTGTQTLSGNSTLTGDVTINGGTLALTGSGAVSGAGIIGVAAGATLDVAGVTSSPYSLVSGQTLNGSGDTGTVNGSLTLSSGAVLTLTYDGANPTLNVPSGTMTLNDNPTSITVTGGALPSGADYTLISQSGGSVAGSVGGTLIIGGDGITGGGSPSLSISGGELVLNIGPAATALRWGGGNGTWAVGTTGWESGGATAFANGDIAILDDTYSSGVTTITLDTVVAPAQVLVTNATASEYTITGTGTITGSSGATFMTKAGTGTLTIAVASTIPSGVIMTGGQLNLNSTTALGAGTSPLAIIGGALGNTSGGTITLANNNPQAWNSDFSFVGTSDLNLGAGAVTLGASRTVTVDTNNLAVGGVISGSGFGLTKAGSGTLSLGGGNTFNGDTRIGNGLLVLANSGALQNSTLDMNGADTGSLAFDASVTAVTFGGLAGAQTRNVALTNDAGSAVALTVGGNNASTTFAGGLSGSGSFTKTGTGTLASGGGGASDPWTYDGDTTISQGTVQMNANNVFPYGSGKGNLIVIGTILNEGRTVSCNGLSGTGTLTSGNSYDHARWSVGNNDASSTFSGQIVRAPAKNNSIYKVGTGTLTVRGVNSIGSVDGFVVEGGRVVAQHSQALGSFRCAVINSGTLEMNSTNGLPVAWDGTLSLVLSNSATLLVSGGSTITYSKSGNPTIGAGANVTLATATSSDTLAIGSAVSGGDVTSLITSAGPGTNALSSGSATGYAGKWRLTGGTLRLSDINSLGASATKAIELAGGTLETRVSAAGTYSTATTVSGNATIKPNQANVGSDHGFGTLSIGNVTLLVSPGSQVTGGTTETNTFTTTTLTGNATFDVANNGTRSMKVVLGAVGETGGPQSLTKTGDGQLEITGAGTYTGSTTVSGGTVLVSSSGSLAAESAVAVSAGATLGGSGTINGPVTLDAGATLSPGASIGTLTVNSNLTLSGNLFIELDKSLSPSNDVVVVAGILTNAGTGTLTVTNLGPALVGGDSFQLFNKPVLNGEALTIVSAGAEVWTNKLAVDGSIAIVPNAPLPVPATNLTIAAAGPNSFSLGGLGAANSAYDVYAYTNVDTPMSNWWLIGTTNSDGSGVIQFFDPQATNDQRFYRFGQTVTP